MTSLEGGTPNLNETDELAANQLASDLVLGAICNLVGHAEMDIPSTSLDTVEEITQLETQHRAMRFIHKAYALSDLSPTDRALAPLNLPMHSVSHISNQFGGRILPCYLNPDSGAGWEEFQALTAHTTDEELILLTNETQFKDFHQGVWEHLAEVDFEVAQTVQARLAKDSNPRNAEQGIIARNDRYQFNGNETHRSLENMLARGVQISVDPRGLESVKQAHQVAGSGILPMTESLKNERVLVVNGFEGSKISLAVHDAIDHTLVFGIAKESGLLSKFRELMQSIGNPQHTDIFKREGETIASISFGVRYWANLEHGFVPIVKVDSLLNHMDGQFDADILQDRHMAAFKILRSLAEKPASREAQSLAFVFSNYIIELGEQRRKHGKIKQRDLDTNHVSGELDPYSADFLALFIELHHELLNSSNKHRDNLLRFHILLEEYLCAVASGAVSDDTRLTIPVQDMRNMDFTGTSLPPNRIQWMTRNYGFTAIRDALL
jgi:hypothetical protein